MLNITTRKISSSVILSVDQFNLLVEQARKSESVSVTETVDDLPIEAVMKLQEQSGALDFLYNSEENIYTVNDVKVRYR